MLSQLGQSIQDSPTIALAQQARALKAQGKDMIDLGTGHLDHEPPQALLDAVQRVTQQAHNARYIPVGGLKELREQIAISASNFYAQTISADNIILTNGAKTALYEILLTLVNPGDEVIVIAPYRPSYIEQIKLIGAIPVIVQSENSCHVDIVKIQKAISNRTKLIITNSPNNPSGAVYNHSTWQTLLDTIRGTDIFLLSDEMYKDFVYDGTYSSPLHIADDTIKKQILIVDGLSKNIAIPGWRVGWTIADPTIIAAMSKIQSNMTGNSNSLIQYALLDFWKENNWSFVDTMRKKLYKTNLRICDMLDKHNVLYTQPSGGLYFFVAVEGDSKIFCQKLLEAYHVSAVPGIYFGREGYIRICYGMDEEIVCKGIEKIITCLGSSG